MTNDYSTTSAHHDQIVAELLLLFFALATMPQNSLISTVFTVFSAIEEVRKNKYH